MKLNKMIDHTLLKPDATLDEVKKICEEALQYDFASVCVNQFFTAFVAQQLKESNVKTCTVVGFPLGSVTKEVKAYETELAIAAGANEIDMVINISALKDKQDMVVLDDIKAVVEAAGSKAIVKVIFETCLLTEEEIVRACQLSVAAGAAFVKTSTGFSKSGATTKDVQLMKQTVGIQAEVKASGGIRDFETAHKMIEAGATRIGTSGGISIISGGQNEPGTY